MRRTSFFFFGNAKAKHKERNKKGRKKQANEKQQIKNEMFFRKWILFVGSLLPPRLLLLLLMLLVAPSTAAVVAPESTDKRMAIATLVRGSTYARSACVLARSLRAAWRPDEPLPPLIALVVATEPNSPTETAQLSTCGWTVSQVLNDSLFVSLSPMLYLFTRADAACWVHRLDQAHQRRMSSRRRWPSASLRTHVRQVGSVGATVRHIALH